MTTLLRTLVLGALLASAPGLSAQSPSEGPTRPHPEAERAISELKSPFCPGQMLETCPSPYAAELRDSIQVLARSGWSSERLIDWVLGDYGEQWRAAPLPEGTGLFAWVIPPVAILAGLAAVLLLVARARNTGRLRETPKREPIGDHERETLDAALRDLERTEDAWF